jgi:hypothetical protein
LPNLHSALPPLGDIVSNETRSASSAQGAPVLDGLEAARSLPRSTRQCCSALTCFCSAGMPKLTAVCAVAALRYGNWKATFLRQDAHGFHVWQERFTALRTHAY